MSATYDYGPLLTYEVTWTTGHSETVQGHQVTFESWAAGFFWRDSPDPASLKCFIHGEFDGRWRLVLAANERDIASIRDVTAGEMIPRG